VARTRAARTADRRPNIEEDAVSSDETTDPTASPAPSEPTDSPGFPDRRLIDLSRDPTPGVPDHAAPDDAGDRPFIDLSRDPTPGVPDHAAPDDA
jgi:hypothetical protein